MPQLPISQAPRENLNVPTPAYQNVAAAGQVDAAIANAAGQVTKFGVDLMEKRKKAADNQYAFKTYVDDYQAIENYSQQLKANVGEDASGYAEKMKAFVEDRRQKGEDAATSSEGLQLYREKAYSLFKGTEVESQNYENTSRAKYYVKSMDENANALAATFLKNPDYGKAKYIQAQLDNEIEQNASTHFVDAGTREKLKQQARNAVSMSVFDGLDAKERYGEMINLVKNTDPNSDIFAGMDAEKRGNLLKRAEAGLQTQRRQSDAELRGQIADVMNAQMHGDEVEAGTLDRLYSKIQTSGLRPDEKEKFGDSIRVSSVVATQKKILMNTPMSLWGNPEDIIPDRGDAKNARVVNQAQAALAREMNQMKKAAAADPAQYAIQSSPALQQARQMIKPGDPTATQDFDSQILARQNALGVSRPRILTSAESTAVAQQVVNASPDEAARSLLALNAAHGKNAPMVFAEVAKDGKLPADIGLIPFMPNQTAAARIVDNLKRAPDIKKQFEADHKGMSDKAMDQMAANALRPYSSALSTQGAGTLTMSSALRSQVKIEAQRRVIMGTDTSPSKAIDNAVKDVVESNFAVTTGGNKPIMIPKLIAGRPVNEDSVNAFLTAHSNADGFAALKVAVPASYTSQLGNLKTGSTQVVSDPLTGATTEVEDTSHDPRQRFYADLTKKGYWVPSADQSELILTMDVHGKPIAIKDEEGNSVRRSLSDISYAPDERTLQAGMPFWKKMFKSNSAQAKPK